jgi:hypothetical protein
MPIIMLPSVITTDSSVAIRVALSIPVTARNETDALEGK